MRFNLLGVEVVVLEVQSEVRIRRYRCFQFHRSGDGHALGNNACPCRSCIVDCLREDVVVGILGINITVIQGTVACRPGEEGEVGIITLDIGITCVDHGAGNGHDHFGIIVISREIGAVGLLGAGIDTDLTQINVVAAVAVNILFHGQLHALAAQIDIIFAGCGIIAVNTGGITAGLDGGIEHIVTACLAAAGCCGFVVFIKGTVGKRDLFIIVEFIGLSVDGDIGLAVRLVYMDGISLRIVKIFGFSTLCVPADIIIEVFIDACRLVELQNGQNSKLCARRRAVLMVAAKVEFNVGGNLVAGIQRQSPGIFGIPKAVKSLKLINIDACGAVDYGVGNAAEIHGLKCNFPFAPGLSAVGGLTHFIVIGGQGVILVRKDLAAGQIVELIGMSRLNDDRLIFHALFQHGELVEILFAFIADPVAVFIFAFITFFCSFFHCEYSGCGSDAGFLSCRIGIHSHQIVGSCCFGCLECNAVAVFGIVRQCPHFVPFAVIECNTQFVLCLKFLCFGARSPALGLNGQLRFGLCGIFVFIKAGKITS